MQSELPSQRNCLARLTPQTFGMFKLGKRTSRLGQSNIVSQRSTCKANRKADILTTRNSFLLLM